MTTLTYAQLMMRVAARYRMPAATIAGVDFVSPVASPPGTAPMRVQDPDRLQACRAIAAQHSLPPAASHR